MLRHGHGENVVAAATPGGAMASSTFSLFFPVHSASQWPAAAAEEGYGDDVSTVTTSAYSSSPSSASTCSVDCTLSLGLPSSCRAEPVAPTKTPAPYQLMPPAVSSWVDTAGESYYCQQGRPAAAGKVAGVGHDHLHDRRCANCGTTSTPLWRNGPRGPKSLCNACGIRFKKEERRAAVTAEGGAGAGMCGFSAHRARAAKAAPPAVACCEETFPCGGEVAEAPFLAWRLNVVPPAAATTFSVWPERASLFQYN